MIKYTSLIVITNTLGEQLKVKLESSVYENRTRSIAINALKEAANIVTASEEFAIHDGLEISIKVRSEQ